MSKSERSPFRDVSNTIGSGNRVPSPRAADPKEAKRQRERDRYAGMSAEQKIDRVKKQRTSNMSDEKRAELNKKRREAYKRKKAQSAGVENVRDGGQDGAPFTDLNTAEEDTDWLHRNESYEPGVTRGADELEAQMTEQDNVIQLLGVPRDIPGPGQLTFVGDLTPNESGGSQVIPKPADFTYNSNGKIPNESSENIWNKNPQQSCHAESIAQANAVCVLVI